MQLLRRFLAGPLELWKPLRRVRERLFFVVHVRDEVGPDVVDGLHVIATLLHECVTVLPAEANEANPAFDAQPCFFESLSPLGYRRSGAHRIVDQDHRFARIDHAFDQFQWAVLFTLFTNE